MWARLFRYFYKSLLNITHPFWWFWASKCDTCSKSDFSLLGFIWHSVSGFVVPQSVCALCSCLSMKSSIWSSMGQIWASLTDRGWDTAANQRHDVLHVADSGLPARVWTSYQVDPTSACRCHPPKQPGATEHFERTLSDVGLKLVWAIEVEADW